MWAFSNKIILSSFFMEKWFAWSNSCIVVSHFLKIFKSHLLCCMTSFPHYRLSGPFCCNCVSWVQGPLSPRSAKFGDLLIYVPASPSIRPTALLSFKKRCERYTINPDVGGSESNAWTLSNNKHCSVYGEYSVDLFEVAQRLMLLTWNKLLLKLCDGNPTSVNQTPIPYISPSSCPYWHWCKGA